MRYTPREINARIELDLLPAESVVHLPRFKYTLEKLSDGWYRAGVDKAYHPNAGWFPAVVLYTPEESPNA